MDIAAMRRKTDRLLAELRVAHDLADTAKIAASRAEIAHDRAVKVQSIVQQVAQGVQTVAHAKVAGLVSKCLRAVFADKSYDLDIDFRQRRGQTEAVLGFARDGATVDPLSASGGGCVAIGSLAARVVAITTERPAKRLLIVLDEPAIHLSPEYRPLFGEMLVELADELSLQIIMSTNMPEFAVGSVIRLE